MKKITALLLVILMCIVAFTACGGDTTTTESNASDEASAPVAQDSSYDVGQFTVTVPAGWKAFPVKDTFGSDPSANKTDTIRIYKGAETEWDAFSKPYVEVIFYDATEGVMPPKTAYNNVVELEAFTTGEHSWTGFVGESGMGKKVTILWEDAGDLEYQVNMWTELGETSYSLEDEDVKKILGSIKPNQSAEAAE